MLGRYEVIEKVALAAIAGLLGYLMRTHRRGKRVRLANCVIETAASGFVGYLSMMLVIAAKIDPNWIGPIVGIMGWMGASSSIKLLEHLVHKKLGINDTNPNIAAVEEAMDVPNDQREEDNDPNK